MSGVLPGIESVSGTAPRGSSNIRHLCRMELAGGGQIVIDGNYAYIGHQHRPQGTTILDVAEERDYDLVSGYGYSLGYLGGGLLFLVSVLMVSKPAMFGIADASEGVELSVGAGGIWWVRFRVPVVFGV